MLTPKGWRSLLALVCIALITAACSSTSVSSGVSPPRARSVSGSLKDWQSAVCMPGMPIGPSTTRGTVSGTQCTPRTGSYYINFDQFTSEYDMDSALSYTSTTGYSAITTLSGHPFAIWMPASLDGAELAPLERFGFVITPPQRRSDTGTSSTIAQPPSSLPSYSTQTPRSTWSTTAPGTATPVTAFTRLDWAGTRCIEVQSAQRSDPTKSASSTVCSDAGNWEYSEHPAAGDLVGGDPVMGDADWISCTLYINGKLDYSDRADAGDGTDVNCLRTVN